MIRLIQRISYFIIIPLAWDYSMYHGLTVAQSFSFVLLMVLYTPHQ